MGEEYYAVGDEQDDHPIVLPSDKKGGPYEDHYDRTEHETPKGWPIFRAANVEVGVVEEVYDDFRGAQGDAGEFGEYEIQQLLKMDDAELLDELKTWIGVIPLEPHQAFLKEFRRLLREEFEEYYGEEEEEA